MLLFRHSGRAAAFAIVAAIPYFPAVVSEQTGHFSDLRPPAAIETIELVQVVFALVVIGVAALTLRQSSSRSPGS